MILMLSVRLAGTIHSYLDAYAPTNLIVRHLRTSPQKGIAVFVSLAPTSAYGFAGAGLTSAVQSGGPGWLNVIVLLLAWNTVKFACLALTSTLSWILAGLRRIALTTTMPHLKSRR